MKKYRLLAILLAFASFGIFTAPAAQAGRVSYEQQAAHYWYPGGFPTYGYNRTCYLRYGRYVCFGNPVGYRFYYGYPYRYYHPYYRPYYHPYYRAYYRGWHGWHRGYWYRY